MDSEYEEDVGKEVKFFLKTGRTYSGVIKKISKEKFVHLIDKFNKLVKFPENNVGSSEHN